MTTIIGRCVFTNAPSFLSWDGDALSLGINILPSTLVEAKAMRQQMLGLMNNPDESVFPVTCSSDSDLDGFYAVTAVQVEPVEAYLTNKLMRCSVGLVRVANGYQNPTLETTVVSRLATNAHSVASTTNHAVAAVVNADGLDASDLTGLSGLVGTDQDISVGVSSTVNVLLFTDTNVSGYYSTFAVAASYYDVIVGSCTIEYLGTDNVWYSVVGRHIPTGSAWRINNGIVRVGTTATMPETNITFSVYDTNQFVGRQISDGSGGYLGGYEGPFIIRNSPEMCIVKVHAGQGYYVTYTVWSGGTIAMVSFTSTTARTFTLSPDGSEAGTNVTGGIRATSNDANGNRLVLLSRQAVTTQTTAPFNVSNTTSATSGTFSIGYNLGAAASPDQFSEAGQLGQLCTPPQWRRRIAAR